MRNSQVTVGIHLKQMPIPSSHLLSLEITTITTLSTWAARWAQAILGT